MILDKFKLDGKVAFVTGSSSGLGQAMAIGLAEAGADVICHASKTGGASETVEKIAALGRKSAEVAGDMSDKDVPRRLIDEITAQFGRIDILVNNAGTIRRSPAVDFTEEDWAFVLEVN